MKKRSNQKEPGRIIPIDSKFIKDEYKNNMRITPREVKLLIAVFMVPQILLFFLKMEGLLLISWPLVFLPIIALIITFVKLYIIIHCNR